MAVGPRLGETGEGCWEALSAAAAGTESTLQHEHQPAVRGLVAVDFSPSFAGFGDANGGENGNNTAAAAGQFWTYWVLSTVFGASHFV